MSLKKDRSRGKNRVEKKGKSLKLGDLESIRLDIDRTDTLIHKYLIDRANLVQKVAKAKKYGKGRKIEMYKPTREHDILNRRILEHQGLFPIESVISVWSELFSGYRSLQGQLKVSYLKPDEVLVRRHFGVCTRYNLLKDYRGVIDALLKEESDVAALPFPNKKNKWCTELLELKTINIVGSAPFNLSKQPNLLLLSKQKLEYSEVNIVFMILKVRNDILNKVLTYLIDNSFVCNQHYSLDKDNSYILFSTKVHSEKKINERMNILRNKRTFKVKLLPKVLGGYPVFKKDI